MLYPVHLILLVVAFVLFVLAGLGIPATQPPKYNLVAFGLAFWLLATFFPGR